jgi:hypothetical protein
MAGNARRGARPRAATTSKPAPEGAIDAPVVVLRWLGDESVFNSGVPNRDVTTDDQLTPELLELAVAAGTHARA